MIRLKKFCLLIAVFALALGIYSARYHFVRGPQLSKLDASSIVVIDYWTGGCDHNQHYLITIRGELQSNARIELVKDAGKTLGFDAANSKIAVVHQDELESIDDYLQTRRTHWFDSGWCTEVRKMSLTWFQAGKLSHQETFVDNLPEDIFDRRSFTLEDLVRPVFPPHIERFNLSTK